MTLSDSARKILNDPARIRARDLWFERLEHVFAGEPDPFDDRYVFAVNGIVSQPPEPSIQYDDPEGYVIQALEDLAARIEETDSDVMFVPACVEVPFYGVHFIDKLFGCTVWFQDGQWYNRYLDAPVGSLERPDLERSPLWQAARRAAECFVRQDVALPLFGLPTIASALNIAINLYGEEILAAMLLEPEAAQHDFQVINDLLCDLHRWYLDHIPLRQLQPVISWNRTQPPGYGQLCGCSLQLISAELHEEFIAPLDDALRAVYPKGGMIHLCGRHDQLLDNFRRMPHLHALQVNDRAAHDLKLYHDRLRRDQILYLNPCPSMTVERAMELTGGDRLVIADTISSLLPKSSRSNPSSAPGEDGGAELPHGSHCG